MAGVTRGSGRRLGQSLFDDCLQRRHATPASGTAAQAFIDCAGSPAASSTAERVPDFRVGDDIARTDDHSGTKSNRGHIGCYPTTSSSLNNAQDQSGTLQRFQTRSEAVPSLDFLKTTVQSKKNS